MQSPHREEYFRRSPTFDLLRVCYNKIRNGGLITPLEHVLVLKTIMIPTKEKRQRYNFRNNPNTPIKEFLRTKKPLITNGFQEHSRNCTECGHCSAPATRNAEHVDLMQGAKSKS